MSYQPAKRDRTFAVVILAALAVIAGILSLVDAARYMGWLPIATFGDMNFVLPQAQWFAAIMAGIVGIIFFVVAMWLWNLNPSGWLFVVVITIFNLIFLGLALIGQTSFNDVMLQLGINALALILALIPSTKQAFLPAPPTPEQVKAATDAAADKRADATAKVAATTAAAADRAAAATDSAADSAAVAAKAAADTVSDAADATADAVGDAANATADAVGDAAEATADAVGDAAEATSETVSETFTRVTGITLTDEQIAEIGSTSLTEIEGIGPKISETLNAAGINTFLDLAVTPVDDLRKILADAGLRADPSTWPEQATLAASGNWDDLKKLQDSLTGGRRT